MRRGNRFLDVPSASCARAAMHARINIRVARILGRLRAVQGRRSRKRTETRITFDAADTK